MYWGVFESDTLCAHVMPCTKVGDPIKPHIASVDCPCQPLPDPETPTRLILVHNDV